MANGVFDRASTDAGATLSVMPGIARIVADNPSLMTYRGTNIYLVEGNGSFGLLDPRPDDDGHPSDILDATGTLSKRP